jgi:hypothetical protein
MRSAGLFKLALPLVLFGCAAVEEYRKPASTTTGQVGVTYSCTDYGKYDSLIDCQTGTLAVCESSVELFPNGGLANCFAPVSNADCVTLQTTIYRPIWIYGAGGGAWCKGSSGTYPSAGFPFYQTRNLIGCSSDVCLCLDALDYTNGTFCMDAATCGGYISPPVGNEPCCVQGGCP